MSRWLLDTNVVSEPRRPRPDGNVLAFLGRHPVSSYFTSDLVLAELRLGIERASDHRLRADLVEWLTFKVRPMFEGRVLAASEDVLLRWRILLGDAHRSRRGASPPDLLVAATAAVHGLTVATRNVADFAAAGVPVVNPWRPVVP